MRAEKVVRHLLGASSVLSGIVGDRIWGGIADDQAPAPLIVFRKLQAERLERLDRETECEVEAVIEIVVAAPTYSQMKDLGEYVRTALTYDESINQTIAGVSVLGITCLSEGEDGYGPERREHFQDWQYRVHHTEP